MWQSLRLVADSAFQAQPVRSFSAAVACTSLLLLCSEQALGERVSSAEVPAVHEHLKLGDGAQAVVLGVAARQRALPVVGQQHLTGAAGYARSAVDLTAHWPSEVDLQRGTGASADFNVSHDARAPAGAVEPGRAHHRTNAVAMTAKGSMVHRAISLVARKPASQGVQSGILEEPRHRLPGPEVQNASLQHAAGGDTTALLLHALATQECCSSGNCSRCTSRASCALNWLLRSPRATAALALLLDIASGIGEIPADERGKEEALRLQRLQALSVLLMVLMGYPGTLLVLLHLAYRKAANDSPVTYYANPRFFTDDSGLEAFLEAFGQAPRSALLHVAGRRPVSEETPGSINWRGQHHEVDFAFSLDLSSWIAQGPSIPVNGSCPPASVQCADAEDLELLKHYLLHDSNDLSFVEMHKEIVWDGWEELATNIRQYLRQCGYQGSIDLTVSKHESLLVYKNKQWANFLHSLLLQIVVALSIVGWIIYVPYMWFRCHGLHIRLQYRVNIDVSDYWTLIVEHLGAYGFGALADSPAAAVSHAASSARSVDEGAPTRTRTARAEAAAA